MFYIKQFFFFSIIGYLFETTIGLIAGNHFNSGILYGPYTPIYGLGILFIFYGGEYLFRHIHLKRWQETIIVFGLFFFIITIIEQVAGILIEKIFHKVFWSYSHLKFNYGPYISLETSLIWSLFGIGIYYIKRPLQKLIEKIPNLICYLLVIIFITDIICTTIHNI